jgi:FkbM family methyltransferase
VLELTPRLRKYGSTSIYMKRLGYEPDLSFLAALIREGDVIVDAGANIGVYTLLLAKRTGDSGHVYAFEPAAEAGRHLRRNCGLNQASNVTVIPAGLSDAESEHTLHHIGGPATYSLGAPKGDPATNSETVRLTTLDAWTAVARIRQLQVLKIDVEGHEPAVLAGGRHTIARMKPLIMLEVSTNALARGGYAADATRSALVAAGYSVFSPESESRLRPAAEAEEGNLFAVHAHSPWPRRLGDAGVELRGN